jgi:hypothetical protein
MAGVTFDHVWKRYGDDVVAVRDFNLEIRTRSSSSSSARRAAARRPRCA